jgi:hypothetical protein
MRKKIPIPQVIADLTALFELGTEEALRLGSTVSGGKFYINKQHYGRGPVIEKLQNYFADKYIDGGYILVDGITFVFTSFEVREGVPEKP